MTDPLWEGLPSHSVLDINSKIVFTGSSEEVLNWLKELVMVEEYWVFVGPTADVMKASQFLDLEES